MGRQPSLSTPRLILRAFELNDAGDVQRLAGDRAVADTTLSIPHPYGDGVAEEWIVKQQPRFEAGEVATFAVTFKESGVLIGAIGLRIERQFDRAELGYWIGKPHWGQGYCTEAGLAVLAFGFTKASLNRVHACHFQRNPASGRVMQKLGMVHEGMERQHFKKWGRYEDVVLYGILKDEWRRCGEPPRADS